MNYDNFMKNVSLKVAPHSKEAEMMVLGCMLTNIDALNISADMLEETDFYFSEHKPIFYALKEMYRRDRPVDVHLVCEELKRTANLEAVGGASYIVTLAQYAGTAAHIEEYAEIVHDKSLLRQMFQAAQKIEKNALEEPEDVGIALDNAQKLFFEIGKSARAGSATLLREVLTGVKAASSLPFIKELEKKQQEYLEKGDNDTIVVGVPTHYTDLDKMLNGFGHSNLIILAGRPAMGKTALALNIAQNVCVKGNKAVGFFSLEMSAEQLVHRVVCAQAEVESDKMRKGAIDAAEYHRICEAVRILENKTLIIDDQSNITISDLKARARRMKESYDIELLVIDYLQLLSGSSSYRAQESRQLEISEISRSLKHLARELNIPVLCAAQLSRKVEERQGHRPMMSDLRESGSLEQDSDVVMLILRRDYYDKNDHPGMAEVIIAKNRHGSVGDVRLCFRKEFGLFANLAIDHLQD
jgi:replicative DNA helicase